MVGLAACAMAVMNFMAHCRFRARKSQGYRGSFSAVRSRVLCVRRRGSERSLPRARVSDSRVHAESLLKPPGTAGLSGGRKRERSHAHVSNRFRGVIISLRMQHASWSIIFKPLASAESTEQMIIERIESREFWQLIFYILPGRDRHLSSTTQITIRKLFAPCIYVRLIAKTGGTLINEIFFSEHFFNQMEFVFLHFCVSISYKRGTEFKTVNCYCYAWSIIVISHVSFWAKIAFKFFVNF